MLGGDSQRPALGSGQGLPGGGCWRAASRSLGEWWGGVPELLGAAGSVSLLCLSFGDVG